MTIRHHLTDALLMAYAAGALPEAFSLVVATHVSLCDECRARLGAFEAVGGAVLEEAPDAPVSAGSLAATLAMIRDRGKDPIVAPAARRPSGGLFPAPLRDYVGGDVEAVKWRPIGGGVRQAILPSSKDASVRLLYIPAGAAVPDHGHRGTELTQVLQGAFRDEDDRFGPGDIEVATEDTQHRPVAEPGVDCICLAATDAPLRFTTMLPRIAQSFFRI
jgi:putative transcriptional regulator